MMLMMTEWYQKSINALALNGKAGRTQGAYSRALAPGAQLLRATPRLHHSRHSPSI